MSSVATKKQRVATENGMNLTIQPRPRNFMLQQGFLTGCQHQEEFVATNETGRKHKYCHNKGSFVTTLIIATWKILLRQKKSFRERPLARQGNVCHDTERRSICHDKVMYVVTSKEKETLVTTDKQGRDM